MKRLFLLLLASCAGLGANDDRDGVVLPTPQSAGASSVLVQVLTESTEVDLVEGPQGGHHITTGIKLDGLNVAHGVVVLHATFVDSNASAGPPNTSAASFVPKGSSCEAVGLTTLIADPTKAHHRTVSIEAKVTIPDGRTGTATQTVLVR